MVLVYESECRDETTTTLTHPDGWWKTALFLLVTATKHRKVKLAMPKKTAVEPLIDLSDDPLKELKVNVRASVLALVGHYVEFYKSVKGGTPDKGRVVDQGLERFFNEDKAFQNYLKSGSAKRAVTPPASANQGAGG